jgi:hypothetical protein
MVWINHSRLLKHSVYVTDAWEHEIISFSSLPLLPAVVQPSSKTERMEKVYFFLLSASLHHEFGCICALTFIPSLPLLIAPKSLFFYS